MARHRPERDATVILKRLELHNFLAWRAPPPISFDGMALVCLSGENGAGKSSLLDAITWALWGKARAKRDEDLIHMGQREMRVSLDFECDGLRYRASRSRSRSGRGSRGALDLFVFGEAGARPINEDGMRRTQDKINAILRLDYDTFVHSAFLQQGKADAFALKTPAERKAILADILRLERWTAREARIKRDLRQITEQNAILEHDIARMTGEIAAAPKLKDELARLEKACESADAELAQLSERHLAVANAMHDLRRGRENLQQKEKQLSARQADMAALEREIARLDGKIGEYEQVIAEADAIEAGYQKLQSARERQSLIAERLARLKALDQETHALERQLAAEKAALQSRRDVASERVAQLQKRIEATSADDLAAAQERLDDLEKLSAQRERESDELARMGRRRSRMRAQLESLTEQGKALSDRLGRLEKADGRTCPLCGNPLTESHRDAMTRQLSGERDGLRERYRECSAEINTINLETKERQDKIDSFAARLKGLPAARETRGVLNAQMAEARDAEAELEHETKALKNLEAQLQAGHFGEDIRRQLDELAEARREINQDDALATGNEGQLEALDAFDQEQRRLEFARMQLPEAVEARGRAIEKRDGMRDSWTQLELDIAGTRAEIKALEAKTENERELRSQLDRMRLEAGSLREERAIARQQLNAIAALRQSQEKLQARLDAARHEKRLLEDLRLAFSRDGLPAMLIETALPDLEAEANTLLTRLTGGELRVALRSQRETVAGKVVETLDIEIADALGKRDYALYSGGEAFRINFAIRMALSRLLARRAGATLNTLFIDEGFGSQDGMGRRKLIDAIRVIKEDFKQILVITHIDELRDAFPTRLLVEKTDEGSRARFLE